MLYRPASVWAALFDPPPFSPQKLKVEYLPGAVPSSGAAEGPLTARRYTLTHNDLTGCLTLSIGRDYNQRQLAGWYTRVVRDEILAEWIPSPAAAAAARTAAAGVGLGHPQADAPAVAQAHLPCLHVYCHVSGEELWPAPPALRSFIFQREMSLVLDTIVHAERALLEAQPRLRTAPIRLHLRSHLPALNRVLDWGQLGDRGSWPKAGSSLLEALLGSVPATPAMPAAAAAAADGAVASTASAARGLPVGNSSRRNADTSSPARPLALGLGSSDTLDKQQPVLLAPASASRKQQPFLDQQRQQRQQQQRGRQPEQAEAVPSLWQSPALATVPAAPLRSYAAKREPTVGRQVPVPAAGTMGAGRPGRRAGRPAGGPSSGGKQPGQVHNGVGSVSLPPGALGHSRAAVVVAAERGPLAPSSPAEAALAAAAVALGDGDAAFAGLSVSTVVAAEEPALAEALIQTRC
ncbi:hypothetical protein N2152v2_000810 [Parachlorella kessleri]